MKHLQSILVGVDFSNCSKSALTQAARISRWGNATLHVVHVTEPLVITEVAEATHQSPDELRAEVVARAKEDLRAWLSEIECREEVELHVECGPPINEILKKVRSVAADLLVLGVQGTTGSGEGAGTLSAKCVRKAPTKVLLVSEPHTKPYRTIVACVDFSEFTPTVVDQAIRLARQEKSQLHLLHVYYGPWHNLHYRAPTPQASPDFQTQYMATLEMRLGDRLKDAEDTQGLDVECELIENRSYGRGIVEYAKQKSADLIVLGTHGSTKLRYILLGCTAERVLKELPCSILAIKPPGYGVKVE